MESEPKAPKIVPPMMVVAWQSALTDRLAHQFQDRIGAFWSYLGQEFVVVEPAAAVPLLEYLKLEEEYEYLVDLTALDYPALAERFELVYILYSFTRNHRVRIKTSVGEGQRPRSAVGVYAGANWLEREVYDMFGIRFEGHPNM